MRIGILTSGGDCPGLNAVIRGATRAAEVTYDSTVIGFRNAWRGVMDTPGQAGVRSTARDRRGRTLRATDPAQSGLAHEPVSHT